MKALKIRVAALLVGILAVSCPISVIADVNSENVLLVDMPMIGGEGDSQFDYILDPQTLIYKTDAARYGGGIVEPGATMLFHNKGGKYDFSSRSNELSIRNRGKLPVKVITQIIVENIEDVEIIGRNQYDGGNKCAMYIALVDNKGNEIPVSSNGIIVYETRLDSLSDNAYVYKPAEMTDSNNKAPKMEIDNDKTPWPVYSFAIKGSCNPDGNWSDLARYPRITFKMTVDTEKAEGDPAVSLSANKYAGTVSNNSMGGVNLPSPQLPAQTPAIHNALPVAPAQPNVNEATPGATQAVGNMSSSSQQTEANSLGNTLSNNAVSSAPATTNNAVKAPVNEAAASETPSQTNNATENNPGAVSGNGI